MKRTLVIAAALAAVPPAAAIGQGQSGGLSPQEIVSARQAAYRLSAGVMSGLKGTIDGDGELRPATFGARALVNWARTLPTMFPAGTDLPTSKARPEVWTDRAGFEARARAYAEAAARMAELLQAGDRAAAAQQFDVLRGSCQACHDRYRVEPQR